MKPTGYNAPSIPRLMSSLSIDKPAAETVRALIRGEVRIADNPAFQVTAKWINQCHHPLPRIERILSALNELLGMHGVECIRNGDGSDTIAEYLNTGDSYECTLLFNHRSRAFSLTSWGDFVERNERRYGIR